MSSLKKIYDSEVTPPAGAWERISRELDELSAFKPLAEKITDAAVEPPPFLWNNITQALSEADQELLLRGKLYAQEQKAPEAVWSHISKELDDQAALEIIEKKLSNIQIQPPSSAWIYIQNELEGKKSKPSLVVPMQHGWLKYAAAACFIAIISLTAFFILNDDSAAPYSATTSGNPSSLASNVKKAVQTTASGQQRLHTPQQQVLAGIRTQLGNAYSVSMERNAELQNRYILLMTQEGNIVRLSKKAGKMADCIAGEDHSCDDQISEWQKEMAGSNTTSSPDNILDILEMASDEKTTIN